MLITLNTLSFASLDRCELDKNNLKKRARVSLMSRTARDINRLLIRERNLDRLLQEVCDILVDNQCYHKTWIMILDESGKTTETAKAGLGEDFVLLSEALMNSKLPNCTQKALLQSSVVTIENPNSECVDCSLLAKHADMGAMAARLEHGEMVYGVLAATMPRDLIYDLDEQRLFNEIAEDVAFGLRTKILEKEKIKAKESLRDNIRRLNDRIKELNLFFSFSNLLETQDITLEEIFQGTVDLIPLAFQNPDITGARIILKDQEFKTNNFKETVWKLVTDINVSVELTGTLEVCYLEKCPERDDGPFLKEERNLINSIAERLGKIITRMHSEKALFKSEKRFQNLVDNSVTGISIIQNGQVVYQNPEQERLCGPLPRKFKLTADDEIHPDDIQKVKLFHEKLMSGESQSLDTNFRVYPSNKARISENIKWVYCRATFIDYQGKEAILMNMMDVTRAKELEHLLRIQDKMTSLGHVAAGIAHEIRNPLSGFNIYLKTLEKIHNREGSQEKVKKILKQLQSASYKIESVIKKVMDFSKPSEPKFSYININQPVEEAINLSSVTLRKSGIEIKKDLAKDLPKCHADPQMMEQVILNLITNAAEAMKDINRPKRLQITSFSENKFVGIKICDSGPGVSHIVRNKIFDPFYTTKADSSGIGLSISHRIVTDHNGSLEVSEGKSGGAEFTVKIPFNKGTS